MFLDSIFTEEGTLRIRYYISENEVEVFRTNMEKVAEKFSTAKLLLERIEEYESSEEDLSEGFTFKGVRTYIEGMEEIGDVFDEHIATISIYGALKDNIEVLKETVEGQQELIETQEKLIGKQEKTLEKQEEMLEKQEVLFKKQEKSFDEAKEIGDKYSKIADNLVKLMKITISSIREKLRAGDYLGAMGTVDSSYERLRAFEKRSLDIDTSLIS